MKAEDILQMMTGEEGEKLYEGIAKSHSESKKKPPVDRQTLGTKDNPLSASLVPTILGCQKRALFRIKDTTDISKKEPILKGNLSDDYIYFSLIGVTEPVLEKFVAVAYKELTEKKRATVITKTKRLVHYLKSGVLGEVKTVLMQQKLCYKIGNLWYSGHVDLATLLPGDKYKYLPVLRPFDFKYSGRDVATLSMTYYPQLYVYHILLQHWLKDISNRQKLMPGVYMERDLNICLQMGGIINTNKIAYRNATLSNLVAKTSSPDIEFNLIEKQLEDLKAVDAGRPVSVSISNDCNFCGLCFKNVEQTHENAFKAHLAVEDMENVEEKEEPVKDETIVKHTKKPETPQKIERHTVLDVDMLCDMLAERKPTETPKIEPTQKKENRYEIKEKEEIEEEKKIERGLEEAKEFIENTIVPVDEETDTGRTVSTGKKPLNLTDTEW